MSCLPPTPATLWEDSASFLRFQAEVLGAELDGISQAPNPEQSLPACSWGRRWGRPLKPQGRRAGAPFRAADADPGTLGGPSPATL